MQKDLQMNNVAFIDIINIFVQKEKETEIGNIPLYNQYIAMGFSSKKCAMLIMNKKRKKNNYKN